MLKETIKYNDYNGQEREEDFYFHLSAAEITEMQFSEVGGLEQLIQKIIKTKDMPSLVKIFKKLILNAYGEISADGRRFEKSEELSKAFSETPAYSILYMRLATDDKAASDFINAIIPQDYLAKAKELEAKQK